MSLLQISLLYSQGRHRRENDSAEPCTHLPPGTKMTSNTNCYHHTHISSTAKHWLIDREDCVSNRLQGVPGQVAVCVSLHDVCEREIWFLRFQVLSNSPHHFTFQFLLASTPRQWNLWFLDRVFLQNRSYRGKIKTPCAVCPLTVLLTEKNWATSHLQNNTSATHSAPVSLVQTVDA